MGVEIERKFLLDGVPSQLDGIAGETIAQGYLTSGEEAVEVRVRLRGERHQLTVKSGGALARVEEEIEIDERCFRSLWALTAGRRLRKRRSRVPLAEGLVAEVDVYEDALLGLVTVEVEFASRGAASRFQPPSWFGVDVTGDRRYRNRTLALNGLPAGNGS